MEMGLKLAIVHSSLNELEQRVQTYGASTSLIFQM
jgi:hypothetical protein